MVLRSGVPRPARYRVERHPSSPVPSVTSAGAGATIRQSTASVQPFWLGYTAC